MEMSVEDVDMDVDMDMVVALVVLMLERSRTVVSRVETGRL